MRIFVDMDGTLAQWHNVEFEQLFEEGYYLNLEPNQEVLADVNQLIRQGKDVYILSAYLTESEYALQEKQEWVKKYLPDFPKEKQIFVPYGEDKANYLKKNYSPITSEDYLLDDYTKNLLEWESFGGSGIKYLNGINHTRGTWQGAKVNYEPFEHTPEIHTLSDIVGYIRDDSQYAPKQYEIDFIGAYEEAKKIPEDKRITRWFGDYGLYELKSNYYNKTLDVAEKVFNKRLEEAIENSSLELSDLDDSLLMSDMRKSFETNFFVEFEKHLPHNMRLKQAQRRQNGEIYWVTYEPFTVLDLREFQQAVKDYAGDVKKFYVTPRDLSGYSFEGDKARGVLAEVTSDNMRYDDYVRAAEAEGFNVRSRPISIYTAASLPESCYIYLPTTQKIGIVKKGENGYYRTDIPCTAENGNEIVEQANERLGISKAQAAAMESGSMFGWNTPAADPKNYDIDGHLIKPKNKDFVR